MNKIKKGDFGYIRYQRKVVLLQTILLFVISIGIFIGGYFYHGKDIKNVLTIVAVLGFLPASKSLVNLIMFIKAKGCSEELKEKIIENAENFHHYFDFYFTAYEKNYPISHMILINRVLIGVTESPKCDSCSCETHLKNILKQDQINDVAIKIYNDTTIYCDKLEELYYEFGTEKDYNLNLEQENMVIDILKAVSL